MVKRFTSSKCDIFRVGHLLLTELLIERLLVRGRFHAYRELVFIYLLFYTEEATALRNLSVHCWSLMLIRVFCVSELSDPIRWNLLLDKLAFGGFRLEPKTIYASISRLWKGWYDGQIGWICSVLLFEMTLSEVIPTVNISVYWRFCAEFVNVFANFGRGAGRKISGDKGANVFCFAVCRLVFLCPPGSVHTQRQNHTAAWVCLWVCTLKVFHVRQPCTRVYDEA